MEFRRANKEEIEKVAAVFCEGQAYIAAQGFDQWQGGYPQRHILENDISLERMYIALQGDEILGAMALFPGREAAYDCLNRENGGEGWINQTELYVTIHRMAVSDAARRKGVGMGMVEFARETALQMGAKSLRIDTHRQNKPMQGLIARCGFSFAGEVLYKQENGCDPVRVAYEKLI